MKFSEALQITQNKPAGDPFSVVLACGFTPLHLRAFLEAHLQLALPGRPVEIATGLYGDLAGTVEAVGRFETQAMPQAIAIAAEWPDLDPRLGYRAAGGWSPADLADIVATVGRSLDRIEQSLRSLPDSLRVALSMPTLPMPPVFYTSSWQSGESEWTLHELVATAARRMAAFPKVAIVSVQRIDELSPHAGRVDLKADLFTGLPYTKTHADVVGGALAGLIATPVPKKGLITDLDDTLWKGILGDAGVENIAWDLAGHAQLHGLYQQLLSALADQGVLVAIASKNSTEAVETAFSRGDILLPQAKVFPMEVNWGAKSASIGRILKMWNIGADSVIFVDDSPMELAEVDAAHPGIECRLFPKDNYAAAIPFLRELRSAFGKTRVSEEDTLRRESIRQGFEFQRLAEDNGSAPEDFLAGMKGRISLDFVDAARDPRVLELVNKTNQFNLNGIRHDDAGWRGQQSHDGAFTASVAYTDRFGPLGKIAVLAGYVDGDILRLTAWVMSCRAFARRIEHQCIRQLFDRFGARELQFEFVATAKNGPTRDFFKSMNTPLPAEGTIRLDRQWFLERCPKLYHDVSYVEPAVAEKSA